MRIAHDLALRYANPEVHKVIRLTGGKFYHIKKQAFIS